MQRIASAVAVAAVLVLVPLGAGTASAAPAVDYPNCPAAHAAGVSNIHVGEPGYRPALDQDDDGVACEDPDASSGGGSSDGGSSESGASPVGYDDAEAGSGQVTLVPEGGAETGDGSTEEGSGWWIGGGIGLASAAALVAVRRRDARRRVS